MLLSRTASPSFGRPPKISVMASASYALAQIWANCQCPHGLRPRSVKIAAVHQERSEARTGLGVGRIESDCPLSQPLAGLLCLDEVPSTKEARPRMLGHD